MRKVRKYKLNWKCHLNVKQGNTKEVQGSPTCIKVKAVLLRDKHAYSHNRRRREKAVDDQSHAAAPLPPEVYSV